MNEEKSRKLEYLEWDLQEVRDAYEKSYVETRRLRFCLKEAEKKLREFKDSLEDK